jgi:hypothetical protein
MNEKERYLPPNNGFTNILENPEEWLLVTWK